MRFRGRCSRRCRGKLYRAVACSELLEPRVLLAAHTWLGIGPTGLNQIWSYGPNWVGGAPGPSETHVSLVFPSFAAQKIITDDIFNLAQVDSITFTGSGYVINGSNSTIHLNAPGAAVNIDDQVGGNTFGNPNLTVYMVPSETCRVLGGRLTIDAKLVNDGASAGSLIKTGNFDLQLGGSSSNSYTGPTIVSDGTLELNNSASVCFSGDLVIGNGSTGGSIPTVREFSNGDFAGTTNITISNGGVLDMQDSLDACANLTMSSGLVAGNTGQLTLNGTLTATSTATGGSLIADKFRMSPGTHVFQIDDGPLADDLTISAAIGETGPSAGFTKFGTGRLTLNGGSPNTYTGTTTIYAGELDLGKTSGNAVAGTLIIGDGFGSAKSDVVRDVAGSNLPPTVNIIMNDTGLLDLGTKNDTCQALSMNGGAVTSSTGTLFVNGNISATSTALDAASISANLQLSQGSHLFTVNDGPQATDLSIWTVSESAASASITKTGAGLMEMNGDNNTYTGSTTVNQGELDLNHTHDPNGLTHLIHGDLIVGDGVGGTDADIVRLLTDQGTSIQTNATVSSSGLLDLGPGTLLQDLTINDGHVTGIATLYNVIMTGGTLDGGLLPFETLTGRSDLTQAATINGFVNFGTFSDGEIDCEDGPLAVDMQINGVINAGRLNDQPYGIVKRGTGTLILAGANPFAGDLEITQGLLIASDPSALGTPDPGTTRRTTVDAGAALELDGVDISNEFLTLNGSGGAFGGALIGQSNATWNRSVTLASNSTISCNNSATLTLDGVISGAGGFTKVGAGTLQLDNPFPNTYAGQTFVFGGTLTLSTKNGPSIPGSLKVGNGEPLRASDIVDALSSRVFGGPVLVRRGGLLYMEANENIPALTLQDVGQATVAGSAAGNHVLTVSALSLDPLTYLDLTNNAMVWNYTGSSPAATARSYLAAAYQTGWGVYGIGSSIASDRRDTAIGFAEASALYTTFPANFVGVPVDDTSLLFRYTLYGDANLDQTVDTVDFNALAGNFGANGAFWYRGDFNFDNVVDTLDFNRLAADFGMSVPPAASAPATLPAVPSLRQSLQVDFSDKLIEGLLT